MFFLVCSVYLFLCSVIDTLPWLFEVTVSEHEWHLVKTTVRDEHHVARTAHDNKTL